MKILTWLLELQNCGRFVPLSIFQCKKMQFYYFANDKKKLFRKKVSHLHLILTELVVMAVERAKSLTGMVVLTRRTKGTVTRGRFTGTALGTGTGERRPR